MPNNPGTRRAGAVVVPAANKIQRGGAVAQTVRSASAALFADQTSPGTSGGSGSGGGSGDVTGPAGAVAGNLASFDGATGKIIEDSGFSAGDFDAAGSAAAVSAALAAETFNVVDYGAQANTAGDWSSDINACIAAAVAYAAANGSATVYFPQGVWFISSEAVATMSGNGSLTVRGAGCSGSTIVQQTAGANGFHGDLTGGGQKIEVCNLGFRTGNVSAGAPVFIDGGTASHGRYLQGSSVHDIYVDGPFADTTEGYGWTNGVVMKNCWGSRVYDMTIFGGTGWTTATPGDGGAGVGSGAALTIQGGTNILVQGIYAQTWSQMVRILPVDGLGGSGLVPQGVHITCFDCVTVMEMIHAYKNSGGDGIDWLTATNFQCDNGNDPSALTTKRGVFIEGGGNAVISDGYLLFRGGESYFELSDCGGVDVHNVRMEDGTGGMTHAVNLTGSSNAHKFLGCEFGGAPIDLAAGAGFNQINNTGASVVTNLGAGNTFLTTCF